MANSSSVAKSKRLRAETREADLPVMRKTFLAEAWRILASSLDYENTLASVAKLVVPQLADWCLIYILDEAGDPQLLAVSHEDPKKVKFAWEMTKAFPVDMERDAGTAQAVHSKQPVLISQDVPEFLRKRARSPEHYLQLISMGLTSVLMVPLIVRDRVLGTLTLAAAESGIRYNAEDQAFAMELAGHAAMAIDNARLYREAQEAMREKDEAIALLHASLQQMPAGVILAEAPSGKILLRNRVATEFWRSKDQLPADVQNYDGYFQAFHPDGRPLRNEEWPLVRSLGGEVVVGEEFEVVRMDGDRKFVRTNSAPIRDRDGKIIAAAVAFEDVSERLLSERALRESEEKFRSLAEVAPCSIFIHDGERLLYVNQATCEISGYSREELLAIDPWKVLHPDSVAAARERIRLRTAGETVPTRFEGKILTKSGEEKWIDFSGGVIEFEGKPAVISVALDVSERLYMDDELQRSQERVRLASESAGISTWEWVIKTNLVIWSPEAYRIFSFNEPDQFGHNFESFLARVHEGDRLFVRQSIERAVSEHKDLSVEFRLRRGDDTWGWAYSRAKMFYDAQGQPERMVGVTIDITGDKLAEAALRESEERFRGTFNQAAVGMVHATTDGTLLKVNQKFCEIVGYSEQELVGRRFQEILHPEDLAANVEKLRAMVEGEISSYRVEMRCLHKDGSQPWAQATASLIRDERGEPKYVITVIEDITERRRAAEALRSSEKLAATGRLAATIAHEINNPLEAVTNLLYLLEQNQSLDESARGFAQMAQEEVSRVAHIARQTLGFYRESSQVEAVQVSRLMDEVVSLFARKIRTSEIELRKELEADAPIEAHPGEIRQVLSNLVTNALDAAGRKGKLRIRIRRGRNPRNRAQRGVRVSIADNGTGIERADLARIFEPFFTTKGAKGTGLGLWVTRGIIEKHGGSIRVWSSRREGRSGSVFSIFLPYKQKAESARPRVPQVI